MKVIFCLHHFLPEVIAGTEVYTFTLAKKLQQLGTDVLILVPNFGNEETVEYKYEDLRVVKYAETSANDRRMILGRVKPAGLKLFTDILRRESPDVVHFHELITGSGPGMYHVQAAKENNFRIVLTAHLSYYSCQTGNLVYKSAILCDGKIDIKRCTACVYQDKGIVGLKATILQKASGLLRSLKVDPLNWNSTLGTALGIPYLITKKQKDLDMLGSLCDKIVSLTQFYYFILKLNGVPENKLTIIQQALPGENNFIHHPLEHYALPLKIVFIGRISHYKGVHLLIEALKEIPLEKISLDIYGEISKDEYVQDCMKNSAAMTNIYWKGTISSEEKIAVLPSYDLLCLPSTFSEMSPLVIQEAFAANIPVLASNVYGNAEQVEDNVTGWLFKFKSAADLGLKLQRLIDYPQLVVAAKKKIPQVRSFTEVAKEYLTIYNEII